MRFLSILTIVFAVFAPQARAQLCGQYTTTLKITDAASGLPLKNPRIRVIPLQEDNYTLGRRFKPEPDDPTRFSVSFNEGFAVKGQYRVVVDAPGYLPAEGKVEFPHCAGQVFQVLLRPRGGTGGGARSELIPLVRVRGEIYSGEKAVSFVNITVLDATSSRPVGKPVRTEFDHNGRFRLELPNGKYSFVFQKDGFKTLRVTNVDLAEPENIYLYNVRLEPGGTDQTIVRDYKDLYKSRSVY